MTSTTTLPSEAELEILRALWQESPATVGEVHGRLPRGDRVGYNTVGKLLQIMVRKGFVACDASARAHRYRPLVERAQTQRRLVNDLAERAFGGSASALALHALRDQALDASELASLRALLAELAEDDDLT